jgi:hypothetical protein
MADGTTKLLLGMIALGLWANVAAPLISAQPAQAQDAAYYLRSIDFHIQALANGVCVNSRLC